MVSMFLLDVGLSIEWEDLLGIAVPSKAFLGGKAKLIKEKESWGVRPPQKLKDVNSFSLQFHGTVKALTLNLARTAN